MKEIRKAVLGQLLHKARQSEVDDLSGYFASGDCRQQCGGIAATDDGAVAVARRRSAAILLRRYSPKVPQQQQQLSES